MTVIISVEGNIGSGKSTLLKQLKFKLPSRILNKRIFFLQEPVSEWERFKNKEGNTIIEEFYKDKKKWGFSFQIMAYISRLKSIKEIIKKNGENIIIICERSLWTDKNVFAKMLYDSDCINDIDYKIYNSWFDEFVENYPLSGILYVNTIANVSHERIKNRNRMGEENISIEYLEECEKYHKDWINNTDTQIMELDGNERDTIDICEETFKNIIGFIKTLSSRVVKIDLSETLNKIYC
tara:strand:+ start:630 stop:1343 length:714 start_codon:yes stop_codon:yes gene_type:complete